MQDHVDARKSTQQCQSDQIRILAMLEDALRVERLVEQHDKEIKEFREDHAKLKASVESLKSPLETVLKKIDAIEVSTTAMSPILKQYSFLRIWSARISYVVTACTFLYILFGSNAVKLIGVILTSM